MEKIKQAFLRDQYAAHSRIALVSVQPGHAVAEVTIEPLHFNGLGTAHGGALFTLADFAFAAASNSHGTVAVAVNVSITFIKAAVAGKLRAEARELSRNAKLGTYTVTITDEAGELVAVFQGLAYRKKEPLPHVE
jgi:acyl-CoA thioesterase